MAFSRRSCSPGTGEHDRHRDWRADYGNIRYSGAVLPAAGPPLWRDIIFAGQAKPTDRISLRTVDATGHDRGTLTSLPPASVFVLSGATTPMVGPAPD